MKYKYLLTIAILLLLPLTALAQDIPDLQNATIFKGSVRINGAPAPDGTDVRAMAGNTLRGSDVGGTSGGTYELAVFNPPNDTITFLVNGIQAATYLLKTADRAQTISIDLSVTTAGPSGGGGGTGTGTGAGGGVISAEPFDNILMYLTIDGNLIANTPVSYNFSRMPPLGIYEILVTGTESQNDVSIRVELLKGTSKLVTASPPGNVYKNDNIWVSSQRIKEGLIRFKVNNTWIAGSGGASGDVKLLKWDGTKWIQLETSEISNDDTYTYYEAKTQTFSPYAISGMKGVIAPGTPGGTGTPGTPIATPIPTPSEKPPAISWAYIIIILIVVIAIVAYLYTAGKKKQKK